MNTKIISGKRRASNSKTSGDIENSISSNIVSSTGCSGGSVIDDFLHRLNNDADLNKSKRRLSLVGASRKNIDKTKTNKEEVGHSSAPSSKKKSITSLLKRFSMVLVTVLVLGLIYNTITSPPEKRLLGSHRIKGFLLWVNENPRTGAAAFIFVYGMFVVFLLPGTPLTLGGGFVYKVAYGWTGGVAVATFTSMAGSLFGSCSCFILGRYVMRDRVRRWGRKYPLFDSLDVAVSDNGFKIMCLLYLTPILPLGPVSYLCGTTSMPLIRFASAKIAALPLVLLYVLIGASTDTFLGDGEYVEAVQGAGRDSPKTIKTIGVDEDTHRKMVLLGLCLSIMSMTLVSHFVKKELFKIFDKQKKEKAQAEENDQNQVDSFNSDGEQVEMIGRKDRLLRRQRAHAGDRLESGLHDEDQG